jgi:hypothetical protein
MTGNFRHILCSVAATLITTMLFLGAAIGPAVVA